MGSNADLPGDRDTVEAVMPDDIERQFKHCWPLLYVDTLVASQQ